MSSNSTDLQAKYQPTKFNCINLFWYGLYLIIAVTLSKKIVGRFGWGPIFACSIIIFVFLGIIVPLVFKFADRIMPLRPTCQDEICHSHEYDLPSKTETGQWIFQCQCGHKYVTSGRKFMRLSDDGKTHPFKIRTWYGQWQKDEP